MMSLRWGELGRVDRKRAIRGGWKFKLVLRGRGF